MSVFRNNLPRSFVLSFFFLFLKFKMDELEKRYLLYHDVVNDDKVWSSVSDDEYVEDAEGTPTDNMSNHNTDTKQSALGDDF